MKLGGGVLAHADHFAAALVEIGAAARQRRLLVVPGGGPFADAVREVDRRLRLSDDAAHWMAVLAMDQHAQLVAARLSGGLLVTEAEEIGAAAQLGLRAGSGAIAVAARGRPTPAWWDVTSDSIAAWVAGAVGARRLVLIKPPHAVGGTLVDGHFSRALPAHVTPVIVTADQVDRLRSALPR